VWLSSEPPADRAIAWFLPRETQVPRRPCRSVLKRTGPAWLQSSWLPTPQENPDQLSPVTSGGALEVEGSGGGGALEMEGLGTGGTTRVTLPLAGVGVQENCDPQWSFGPFTRLPTALPSTQDCRFLFLLK
jgi:hypothetical protein